VALGLLEIATGQIAAVVMGVRMPNMDGVSLAEAIRRMDAPPPFLFISGFERIAKLPSSIQEALLAQVLLDALNQILSSSVVRGLRVP
jgi:CheY-like chemotaxis protein